ncbi:MAG: PAS domain S-box protein [Dehalococcoidia bacterium]|nr:PAS domain S-box protein [Dehalococcoidia bacterium]
MGFVVYGYLKTVSSLRTEISERVKAEVKLTHTYPILLTIRNINQLIAQTNNESELLQRACEILVDGSNYKIAWFGFIQEGSYEILTVAQSGFEEGYLSSIKITWDDSEYGQGPTGTAIKTKRPAIMQDIAHDERYRPWREQALLRGYASSAALPLKVENRVIGTLNVYSAKADAFDDTEIEMFAELAGDICLGIQKIRQREALRKSEERFRLMVEGVKEYAIIMLDPDGYVTTWNTGAERINGYKAKEIIGKHFSLFYPAQDVQQGKPAYGLKVAAAEGHFEDEGWRVRKDGSRFWANDVMTALRDEAGNPYGFSKVTKDLTERKQAEEALRLSEEKYRTLVDNATVGVFRTNLKGDIIYVNDALVSILGFDSVEEIIASGALTRYKNPDDWALLIQTLTKEGKVNNFEFELLTKTGETKNGILNVVLQGDIISGMLIDVTELKKTEEALRDSEQNFRSSLIESPLGIRIVNAQGENLYVNQALLNIFGFGSIEEFEKVILIDRYTPESRILALERREQRQRGETGPASYEVSIVRKDGSIRNIEVFQKQVVWNGEKQFQLVCNDVTERKKSERALEESEKRYRSLFENMLEGFAYCRMIFEDGLPKDFIYLAVNSAFEHLTGLENVAGKKVSEVIPGIQESNPELFEIYGRVASTGNPEQFETYLGQLERWFSITVYSPGSGYFIAVFDNVTARKKLEQEREMLARFPLENPNPVMRIDKRGVILYANGASTPLQAFWNRYQGERMPVEWCDKVAEVISSQSTSITEITFNGHTYSLSLVPIKGRDYVNLYGRDITEQKNAEQTLRESEQNFRNSLNNSPLGIRVVHTDGETLYVNQALLNIFGYESMQELEATTLEQRYTPDGYREVVERREKRRKGEKTTDNYEVGIRRKDGEIRHLQVFRKVVLWGGESHTQLLYNDITEHRQAEEKIRELEVLKELDRVRSEFLANVSHELRTPLAAIKGFTSTLLRDDVQWRKAERTDFLQTIDQETDRLTRLINDLLDMSRLEAISMSLKRAEYNVEDIFSAVYGRLSSLASRHRLEYVTGENLPRLYVDEMRIGQVISNLVDNAVKHSPAGSVITISAYAGEGEVIISVTDRGEGIPVAYLEKIFDRFVQVESIVAGRKGGTGLGLSICRGIVENHGGKIWVESKSGKGSKFSFSLPAQKGVVDA